MSEDLGYEVDVMDDKLATLKEYLPDDMPGSADVAMLDVENHWKDVRKAAEHATAEILGKQDEIDDLKTEVAGLRQELADAEASLDEKQSEIDRLTDRYPQHHGTEEPE
jgi:chromosome segregation ATPase